MALRGLAKADFNGITGRVIMLYDNNKATVKLDNGVGILKFKTRHLRVLADGEPKNVGSGAKSVSKRTSSMANSVANSMTNSIAGRQRSHASVLGVRAATIKRAPNARHTLVVAAEADVKTVKGLARELAEVCQEATLTREAVLEWWDVNVTPLNNRKTERDLLVQLAEELRPALRFARIFMRL